MASIRFCNACHFNSTIDSGTIMQGRGKRCPTYDFSFFFFIEKLREENEVKRVHFEYVWFRTRVLANARMANRFATVCPKPLKVSSKYYPADLPWIG